MAREMLAAGVMHPMSFVHKRVHWSAVATGRKMFAAIADMTAARFDLLHVLYTNRRFWMRLAGIDEQAGAMTQGDLRRALGVTRQTVWKMVKRLVELGLVVKDVQHGRFVVVRLTKDGLTRMSAAYAAAFTEREEPSAPKEIASTKQPAPDDNATFDRERVMSYIDRFRRKLATSRTVGREVARVFTTYAWERVGGGRLRHTVRQLDLLDQMVRDTHEIARALGDTSELIYPFGVELDH